MIFVRPCDYMKDNIHTMYSDGEPVETCADCVYLIHGRGALFLRDHEEWCDIYEKVLLLSPRRTRACRYYQGKEW